MRNYFRKLQSWDLEKSQFRVELGLCESRTCFLLESWHLSKWCHLCNLGRVKQSRRRSSVSFEGNRTVLEWNRNLQLYLVKGCDANGSIKKKKNKTESISKLLCHWELIWSTGGSNEFWLKSPSEMLHNNPKDHCKDSRRIKEKASMFAPFV